MCETIKEPQLPKHERGLDVTLRVTRYVILVICIRRKCLVLLYTYVY